MELNRGWLTQNITVQGEIVIDAFRIENSYGHACWRLVTGNSDYLLKLCIRRPNNEALSNETTAHKLLSDRGVQVPRIIAVHPMPNELGYPYYIQEWLPGEAADTAINNLDTSRRNDFAVDFGRCVANMHTIPGPFFAGDLLGTGSFALLRDYCLARLTSTVESIGPQLYAPQKLERVDGLIKESLSRIDHDTPPSFVHRDLYLPNVLISNGQFSGLIDLESARFNDPMLEFVKLDAWVFSRWPQLREPFVAAYQQVHALTPDRQRRVRIHQGIEYLYSVWYFGEKFPSPEMLQSFVVLLDRWLDESDAC